MVTFDGHDDASCTSGATHADRADYKPLKAGEKVGVGDIVIYSTNGDLPHSGKVTEVDANGKAVKVQGKWGHYSLFEHPPDAVPAHYGKPTFYRKK